MSHNLELERRLSLSGIERDLSVGIQFDDHRTNVALHSFEDAVGDGSYHVHGVRALEGWSMEITA